ncbi:MAG: hypothetical protein L6U99_11270 [Clostridium sp.]|nr:MAG: hypothetical protein L6U99_11270 [Clostridium sp.]
MAIINIILKTVNNENGYKGDILAPFDRKYINKINAIFLIMLDFKGRL